MRLSAALLVTCAATLVAVPAIADDVVRVGTGDHRRQLDKLELAPFPADAWAKLSAWTNGTFAPGAISGKPVLIVTWLDYTPAGKRAVGLAKRMADKFAGDGLVVIAVHGEQEWDKAAKPTAGPGATLLVAHDAKGEFRAAVSADHDPAFFVVDRSGQMRFADVASESVEAAVTIVAKESPEQAGGVKGRLAADAAQRDADLRRSNAINQGADLRAIPEVDFEVPKPDAYKGLKWPTMPKEDNNSGREPQGEIAFPKLDSPAWLNGKKPNPKGRASVVYFWSPTSRATYENAMPRMDLLQRQHARDLNVIGVMTFITENNSGARNPDDEKVFVESLRKFAVSRNVDHFIMPDAGGSVMTTALNGRQYTWQGTTRPPLPLVAVVSSDGVMRWSGWLETDAFMAAVDQVVAVDPGIRARRAAEDAYLRKVAPGSRQVESSKPVSAGPVSAGPSTPSAPIPPSPSNAADVYRSLGTSLGKAFDLAGDSGGDDVLRAKDADVRALVAATRAPVCNFGIDYSKGLETELPHLSQMRSLARVLAGDASRQLAAGDASAAADRVAALFGMSLHLANSSRTVIEVLVASAVAELGTNAVKDKQGLKSAPNKAEIQKAAEAFAAAMKQAVPTVVQSDLGGSIVSLRAGTVPDSTTGGGTNWPTVPQAERDAVATKLEALRPRLIEAVGKPDAVAQLDAITKEAGPRCAEFIGFFGRLVTKAQMAQKAAEDVGAALR